MIVKRLLEMKQMNNSPVVVTYNEQPIETEKFLDEESRQSSESDKIKVEKVKIDKNKSDKVKTEKVDKIKTAEKSKFEPSDSDDSPVAKKVKKDHPKVFLS